MQTLKITFNTGRLYTKEGQVITAHWDPDAELISFNDHSRMIMGEIRMSQRMCDPMTPSFLASELMRRYDRGEYLMAWPEMCDDRCPKVHQFRL